MDNKPLSKFINEFRNEYIGKKINMQEIKNILENHYQMKINNIIENNNIICIDIEPINVIDHEMNIYINKLDIIMKKEIIVYLVLEQQTTSIMISSLKQRNYIGKENQLFVSTVNMNKTIVMDNSHYETMINYNGEFFYQDRYPTEEVAVYFNNYIFNEIAEGKTIEEIKALYSNETGIL